MGHVTLGVAGLAQLSGSLSLGSASTQTLWAAVCTQERMDQHQPRGASGRGQPCLATLLPLAPAQGWLASSPVTAPALRSRDVLSPLDPKPGEGA